jgi:hypothetical protein
MAPSSFFGDARRRFLKNRAAVFALGVLLAMIMTWRTTHVLDPLHSGKADKAST